MNKYKYKVRFKISLYNNKNKNYNHRTTNSSIIISTTEKIDDYRKTILQQTPSSGTPTSFFFLLGMAVRSKKLSTESNFGPLTLRGIGHYIYNSEGERAASLKRPGENTDVSTSHCVMSSCDVYFVFR